MNGMACLKRRDDSLSAGQQVEGIKRLGVRSSHIVHATGILPVTVLWPDAWIVKTRAATVNVGSLPRRILQHIAERAVEHAWSPVRERRSVIAGARPATTSFNTHELDA